MDEANKPYLIYTHMDFDKAISIAGTWSKHTKKRGAVGSKKPWSRQGLLLSCLQIWADMR